MLLIFMFVESYAQTVDDPNSYSAALKVNLDCNFCDHDYIRQEINYVDYVRDQGDADVHIFFVRNATGSGGRVYEISFFGKNDFEDSFYKLELTTGTLDSPDEIRAKIKETIAAGLVPYLYNSKSGYDISVSNEVSSLSENEQEVPVKDPWNYWVFEISAAADFEWESQEKNIEYEYNLEADRITDKYRFSHDLYSETNNKTIQDTINIKVTRSYYAGRLIKSLNENWSAGVFTRLESNSFRNIDLMSRSTLAIEYNVFPWSELSKKQFTINYHIGYLYQKYTTLTIFDKGEDLIPIHSVRAEVRFNQPWGTIFNRLEYAQFIDNAERKNLDWEFNVNVRLFKGLAARVSGGYEIVRDQVNLAKGETTFEDIITKQREVATAFDAYLRVGFSYTFGSIFNNAVNQRL